MLLILFCSALSYCLQWQTGFCRRDLSMCHLDNSVTPFSCCFEKVKLLSNGCLFCPAWHVHRASVRTYNASKILHGCLFYGRYLHIIVDLSWDIFIPDQVLALLHRVEGLFRLGQIFRHTGFPWYIVPFLHGFDHLSGSFIFTCAFTVTISNWCRWL